MDTGTALGLLRYQALLFKNMSQARRQPAQRPPSPDGVHHAAPNGSWRVGFSKGYVAGFAQT
eukprot:366473-Chlamydomonas_euryale.AAC.7